MGNFYFVSCFLACLTPSLLSACAGCMVSSTVSLGSIVTGTQRSEVVGRKNSFYVKGLFGFREHPLVHNCQPDKAIRRALGPRCAGSPERVPVLSPLYSGLRCTEPERVPKPTDLGASHKVLSTASLLSACAGCMVSKYLFSNASFECFASSGLGGNRSRRVFMP